MSCELYFVIRHERSLERIYRVETAETTIGRSHANVLCLPDKMVSRRHAVLLNTTNEFRIRDLSSRNGTRLNGRLLGEAVISVAAVVEIGVYSLTAHIDLDSAQRDADESEESTGKFVPSATLAGSLRDQAEQKLTIAQRRVYYELLKGHSEKEIALVLQISVNTVHTHSRAIYTAFAVSSRAELMAR